MRNRSRSSTRQAYDPPDGLGLHSRPRHGRGPPGRGCDRRALARRRASRRVHDRSRRAHLGRVRGPGPGTWPLQTRLLGPSLPVLQPRRARGRARRGPSPRPAARLALLVRELPRQLSAGELAGLFEGRTRLVELLSAREHPLDHAEDAIAELTEAEKLEALQAHPATGVRAGLSARSAREQGSDDEPAVLEELA